MNRPVAIVGAFLLCAASAVDAGAGQTQNNLRVNAVLEASCDCDTSPADLNFSIPAGSTGPVPSMGTGSLLEFTCTPGANWILSDAENPGVEDGVFTGVAQDASLNEITFHLTYGPTSGTGSSASVITGFINETETPPAEGYSGKPPGVYSASVQFILEF